MWKRRPKGREGAPSREAVAAGGGGGALPSSLPLLLAAKTLPSGRSTAGKAAFGPRGGDMREEEAALLLGPGLALSAVGQRTGFVCLKMTRCYTAGQRQVCWTAKCSTEKFQFWRSGSRATFASRNPAQTDMESPAPNLHLNSWPHWPPGQEASSCVLPASYLLQYRHTRKAAHGLRECQPTLHNIWLLRHSMGDAQCAPIGFASSAAFPLTGDRQAETFCPYPLARQHARDEPVFGLPICCLLSLPATFATAGRCWLRFAALNCTAGALGKVGSCFK